MSTPSAQIFASKTHPPYDDPELLREMADSRAEAVQQELEHLTVPEIVFA